MDRGSGARDCRLHPENRGEILAFNRTLTWEERKE